MKTILQRFEEKFTPEALTGCWLWTAACQPSGYGHMVLNGKVTTAHRISYELYVSEIPDGMFVLHRCDVKLCVNPKHLFLGTQKENMLDMSAKGRADYKHRGPLGVNAKLSESQARAIIADNRSHTKIAKDYGIAKSTVGAIKSGITWAKFLKAAA